MPEDPDTDVMKAEVRKVGGVLIYRGVAAVTAASDVEKCPAAFGGVVDGIRVTETRRFLPPLPILAAGSASLKVEDYFQNGKRSVVRLRTKGGKEKEFPVHHLLEDILDAYLDISGLRANPAGPLFPTTRGKSRELGSRPMTRIDAARMLKRRLAQAGIVGSYSPHSFRASGLTRFLEEGGTLEGAQNIADHADSRTTKLYDRRQQVVLREDVERIRY